MKVDSIERLTWTQPKSYSLIVGTLLLLLVSPALWLLLTDFPKTVELKEGLAVLLFFLAGVYLTFGREGYTLDRESGKVKVWRGLFWSKWGPKYDLGQAREVLVDREELVSSRRSALRNPYRVYLRLWDGRVLLGRSAYHHHARLQGEAVAKFLDVGMTDKATKDTVVREAGFLDESLRARYRRTGEKRPLEPLPLYSSKVQFKKEGDKLIFCCKGPGLTGPALIAVLIGTPFLFISVAALLSLPLELARGLGAPLTEEDLTMLLGVGTTVVVFLAIVYFFWYAKGTRILTLSPDSLSYRVTGWTKVLPTEEIEEVHALTNSAAVEGLADGGRLEIRGDARFIVIHRLPARELEWISSKIHAYLARLEEPGRGSVTGAVER